MAVDSTIICDNPECGKPIDGNHFELYYTSRAVDPNADDHAYETGTFHFHLECFDVKVREALGADDPNPQTAFREAKAAAEAADQQASEELDAFLADKPDDIKTMAQQMRDSGIANSVVKATVENHVEAQSSAQEVTDPGEAQDSMPPVTASS